MELKSWKSSSENNYHMHHNLNHRYSVIYILFDLMKTTAQSTNSTEKFSVKCITYILTHLPLRDTFCCYMFLYPDILGSVQQTHFQWHLQFCVWNKFWYTELILTSEKGPFSPANNCSVKYYSICKQPWDCLFAFVPKSRSWTGDQILQFPPCHKCS